MSNPKSWNPMHELKRESKIWNAHSAVHTKKWKMFAKGGVKGIMVLTTGCPDAMFLAIYRGCLNGMWPNWWSSWWSPKAWNCKKRDATDFWLPVLWPSVSNIEIRDETLNGGSKIETRRNGDTNLGQNPNQRRNGETSFRLEPLFVFLSWRSGDVSLFNMAIRTTRRALVSKHSKWGKLLQKTETSRREFQRNETRDEISPSRLGGNTGSVTLLWPEMRL